MPTTHPHQPQLTSSHYAPCSIGQTPAAPPIHQLRRLASLPHTILCMPASNPLCGHRMRQWYHSSPQAPALIHIGAHGRFHITTETHSTGDRLQTVSAAMHADSWLQLGDTTFQALTALIVYVDLDKHLAYPLPTASPEQTSPNATFAAAQREAPPGAPLPAEPSSSSQDTSSHLVAVPPDTPPHSGTLHGGAVELHSRTVTPFSPPSQPLPPTPFASPPAAPHTAAAAGHAQTHSPAAPSIPSTSYAAAATPASPPRTPRASPRRCSPRSAAGDALYRTGSSPLPASCRGEPNSHSAAQEAGGSVSSDSVAGAEAAEAAWAALHCRPPDSGSSSSSRSPTGGASAAASDSAEAPLSAVEIRAAHDWFCALPQYSVPTVAVLPDGTLSLCTRSSSVTSAVGPGDALADACDLAPLADAVNDLQTSGAAAHHAPLAGGACGASSRSEAASSDSTQHASYPTRPEPPGVGGEPRRGCAVCGTAAPLLDCVDDSVGTEDGEPLLGTQHNSDGPPANPAGLRSPEFAVLPLSQSGRHRQQSSVGSTGSGGCGSVAHHSSGAACGECIRSRQHPQLLGCSSQDGFAEGEGTGHDRQAGPAMSLREDLGRPAAGRGGHAGASLEPPADVPADAEGAGGPGTDCVVHLTVAPRLPPQPVMRRSSRRGGGAAEVAAATSPRPVQAAAEPWDTAGNATANDVGAISPYYFYRKTLSLADFAHAQPELLLRGI